MDPSPAPSVPSLFGDGGPPHRGILAKGETHGAQIIPGGGGCLEAKKRILPVTNGKKGEHAAA
jgi:hypothetical protein